MPNLSDKFSTYGLSLATAQVEYLLNTNTATSGSDTSSFGYGSSGQSIVAFSSSGNWVTKRVQSIVAMTPQDRITVEVSKDGNEWIDASSAFPAMESGSNKYGIDIEPVDSTNLQLDIRFGGNGANGTEAWSAYTSYFWRVRVTRANLAAGFGTATSSTAGIIYKPRYQKKELTATLSATTDSISALGFSGLTVGRVYRLTGAMYCQQASSGTGNQFARLKWKHNSLVVVGLEHRTDSRPNTTVATPSVSNIFTATTTTIVCDLQILGTGITVEAGASGERVTFAILEDITDSMEVTTAWT